MIDQRDIDRMSRRLEALLQEKLKVSGRSFAQATRRAGRRLSKTFHAHAAIFAAGQAAAAHPRLALTHDRAAVDKAYDAMVAELEAIDPRDRRIGAILGLLGGLSFNLIAAFVLLICLLIWRGFL